MSMTKYANDIRTGPTTIAALECANCGVVFGINAEYEARRREDGRGFYCPNGHVLSWKGTNEKKQLERRLASAESQNTHLRDQRDAAERSKRAYKGQVTKIKRRVGNGVCPCCNRSFENLARHMEAKHPDYADGDS